jgi:HEAT repeat protein
MSKQFSVGQRTLFISLVLLSSACLRSRTRKITDSSVVRSKSSAPPKKKNMVPREITLQDIHSPAFTLRRQVRAELLARGKAGQLEYDLASLHEAEGLAVDHRDPEIPGAVRDVAMRLQASARAPAGAKVVLALISELRTFDCPVRHLMALILASVPGADISRALIDHARSPNVELRRCAVAALGHRSDQDIALALIPSLVDKECGQAAILSIVRLSRQDKHRNGIEEAVLKALSTDSMDLHGRIRLIELSGQLNLSQAGQMMTQWLAEDVDKRISVAVARALKRLPGRFVTQQLRASISDPRAEVRVLVIEALGAAQDVFSSEIFRVLSRRDASWQVRKACVAAFAAVKDQRSQEALLAALTDSVWQVRVEALRTLRILKFPGACLGIRPQLSSSRFPKEREAVALALGALKDEASIGTLGLRLKKDLETVRVAAATALGEIGTVAALAELNEGIEGNRALPSVLLAIIRSCREAPGSQSLAGALLAKNIFNMAAQSEENLLLRTAAMMTAYKFKHPKAAARLLALGDRMLALLSSDSLAERRLGRLMLLEIAGRDFFFNPAAVADDRESLGLQIKKWWLWKRAAFD